MFDLILRLVKVKATIVSSHSRIFEFFENSIRKWQELAELNQLLVVIYYRFDYVTVSD